MDEFTGEQRRPDDDGDPAHEAVPVGRWVNGRWRPDHVDRAEEGDAAPDETGDAAKTGRGRWDRGERATGPVRELASGLADALEALVGPEGLDDESLGEVVVDLVRLRSVLDARTAGLVARWDARSLWADDGSRAPRARLARDAGCHQASAGRLVRNARGTRSIPIVTEAWQAGRISTDHVERLVRAATPERAEGFTKLEDRLVTVAATCD